jgi:disulfide bond formation protein DsbB
MKFLSELTTNSTPWLLLALSALGLELCALFFQYVMDLAPCIMCVYQRLAIAAIFLAGVVGFFAHHFLLTRIIAHALWATGAIWGLIIALEHIEIQANSNSLFFSCDIVPNFPSWAPLHQWLPAIFEATGDCGEISWQFLSYSMPQWMIVVYGVYSAIFILVVMSSLIHKKSL